MPGRQHTEHPVSTETDGLLFQRLQVVLLAGVILVLASCSFEVSAGLAVTPEDIQLTSTFRVSIGAIQYQALICDNTTRQNKHSRPKRATRKDGPKRASNKMNNPQTLFSLDAVTPIQGSVVSTKQFVGVVQISTLVGTLTEDPTKFGDRKLKDGELDPVSTPDRNAIQRPLLGAKKKNVGAIADYIRCDVAQDEGILPPITLFSSTALTMDETGNLRIPHGQKLFALDGETQLAAWHDLWKQDRNGFGGMLVPVVVHHGRSRTWGEQMYCDRNSKGIRPNRNQVICRDHREKQTCIVDELIKEVPLFRGGILRDKVGLPANTEQVLTYACLYDTVCAMLQKSHAPNKNYDYGNLDWEDATSKIIAFFKEFTETFKKEIRERKDFLISSQPAMLGIGAFAKKVLDPAASEDVVQVVLDRLLEVDWSNGDHWIGILQENRVDKEGNEKKTLRRKKDGAKDTFNALAEAASADGKAITKAPAAATSDA